MAADLEREGNALYVDEEYEEALERYSKGLELEPQNASLYSSRAAAQLKLENFLDAISDANKAIDIDPTISKAYLRKGMACFSLEEFQTAKVAFEAGFKLDPKNSQFKTWIRKCDVELADENESLAPATVQTSTPTAPGIASEAAKDAPSSLSEKQEKSTKDPSAVSDVKEKDAEMPDAPQPTPPPPPKYRCEDSQRVPLLGQRPPWLVSQWSTEL